MSGSLQRLMRIFLAIILCSIASWDKSSQIHATPQSDPPPQTSVQTATPIWAHPGAAIAIRNSNTIRICSVGIPLTDSHDNRYFLTASHCFRNENGEIINAQGSIVYTDDGSDTWAIPIGKEFFTPAPVGRHFYDTTLVKLFPKKIVLTSGWVGLPHNFHNTKMGDNVCALGLRESRSRCGDVTALHQGLKVGNYQLYAVSDTASICVLNGDSGGPVYDNQGIVGIISSGRGWPFCSSNFVPITEVLNQMHQRIPSLYMP